MTLTSQFFNSADYLLSLPVIMVTMFGLGTLLIDLILPREWKVVNAWSAFAGLVFSAVAVYKIQLAYHNTALRGMAPLHVGFMGSWAVDPFAIFFWYLFLAAAAITVLMSARYLDVENEQHGEYYALILFSVAGMMCMAAGYDIIILFIGLELMAISTYVLVGFLRNDRRSNEAALKYLLLGAFSSGIFAYGLSLFYGLTGSTNLGQIAARLQGQQFGPVHALALITTAAGLFFKIAAVPFHQWAPDAYEGAPTAITGFMSVAGKSAAWALLLRIFLNGLNPLRPEYLPLVIFVAIATMTGGNLAALTQSNLKRLLAYSSIAHVGYMLLGLAAGDRASPSATGVKGIIVYLLVYTFMNLGAFAVIISLRRRDIIGDELDDISGLFFKAPTEAVLMLIFLLSLAGIPPLAGFYGKYFIFLGLMESGHYVLASLAVIYVAVSLYYYLKIANAMFMREALDAEPVRPSPGVAVALAVTALATVYIGIFPEWFIRVANWSLQLPQTASVAQLVK
ncbi:MAG TPA: NADH-quinone oxidoreductase subunit N [Terriglobales bacterium]|nr:NADH-quinone oxidoreductase subunit N [Terriglobales bacterium]